VSWLTPQQNIIKYKRDMSWWCLVSGLQTEAVTYVAGTYVAGNRHAADQLGSSHECDGVAGSELLEHMLCIIQG